MTVRRLIGIFGVICCLLYGMGSTLALTASSFTASFVTVIVLGFFLGTLMASVSFIMNTRFRVVSWGCSIFWLAFLVLAVISYQDWNFNIGGSGFLGFIGYLDFVLGFGFLMIGFPAIVFLDNLIRFDWIDQKMPIVKKLLDNGQL